MSFYLTLTINKKNHLIRGGFNLNIKLVLIIVPTIPWSEQGCSSRNIWVKKSFIS